jgi:hypothetical protein
MWEIRPHKGSGTRMESNQHLEMLLITHVYSIKTNPVGSELDSPKVSVPGLSRVPTISCTYSLALR